MHPLSARPWLHHSLGWKLFSCYRALATQPTRLAVSSVVGGISIRNIWFAIYVQFHFQCSVSYTTCCRDHWEAPQHKDERRFLIEHLQMMARARHWRVSLISGDVHLCAVGRLYSWPKMKNRLSHDARFMPQIISSAIVNCPPPDLLLKVGAG